MLHVVVILSNPGSGEGVGLADVGSGLKVLFVDVIDDVGLRQREQIVVSLDGLWVLLELLPAKILKLIKVISYLISCSVISSRSLTSSSRSCL